MQPMQSESVTRGQVKTDENKDDMRNVHRIEISTLSLLGEHVENICTNCLSCHVMSCDVSDGIKPSRYPILDILVLTTLTKLH